MTVEEILTKLVSFPVLGGESNLSILSWIEEYLDKHGVEHHRVPNEDGTKANLHCRIGSEVEGGVILSGHMDVVPVKGQAWDTDPWVLTDKEDGKLYSRGSCDMKGFVACCLAALPAMLKADLKAPIYFAFSYDEEIGCLGAPDLVKAINVHYKVKPKFAIIGEPTMMRPVTGQKGICIFETTVSGSEGHSSRIKQEVSAIHEAMRLILWLENKMNSLIEAGRTDDRFTPNHTSIHIGMVKGGIAPNVIAQECKFSWDVRTIPSETPQEIKAEFDLYCRQREAELRKIHPDFKISTSNVHPAVPGLNTANDQEVVALVKDLVRNPKLDAVSYAAEAGQFAEGGFQAVICGPGDIAQAHRANEFIHKDQLIQGMEFMDKLIEKLS
ncbi:acetylornithine deacetylase [Roseivirga ehrenbergii]|uniref:Acetylornithine deacetylase n=1 Tax=Roseivirga ehrenbergii (strain DSM 102268 / JCM 13514 / KCTC 12282 / NCIMB 14502 / KMM 6017) TaxID=279360 RepID=A0A150X8V8_ROSEK|nr:acetylornithine deacetylase [Roseivirga ehrenbergii]KYG75133.1 acetylornithine deacetylase [Roseivirga ehrenbergii]TCL13665.1 acetylornithine deacetylase [Roseivirga ehrenbergii]